MNQLITNKTKSKTIMRQNLRKRKSRLVMRATFLALCALIFMVPAKAQNVYMHTGSMTVPSSGTVNFYDSGGESHGPDYYWERWFQRNEEFTYTFSPAETGKKIKVTFNTFTAYSDNGGTNHPIGSDWSLRLNTAELSVYDGSEVNADNLITTYTGNMTGAFSVIANGPITFYFHSYSYREEGWQATVQCVDSYELQMPQISFEACSDAIVINANNKGAEIYYTTNGSDPVVADPLTGATLYEGPFNVEVGTTIKAIAYLNNASSSVGSKVFADTDVTPTPGVPTITRNGNTITMTPAAISAEINETYYVWYTTDGSVPTPTNGIRYTGPLEWHTPHTTFKAVTRAETCSDKLSEVVELTFENVQVPTPTITFPNGNATIACTMQGVTIYYTTDGSTPTTSSTAYTAPFAVSYGTTVKAIAVMTGQDGYDDSDVATDIYVPEGGSGTDGSVVILDDREDHTWSYYSDGDQPIHSLKPADVKITYTGYGDNTMTGTSTANMPANADFTEDVESSQVAVNVGETENQFIYLKTLENANAAGTGNYPYTMIANPFQVRPKGEDATGTITYTSYDKVTSAPSDWSGDYLLVYQSGGYAFDGTYDSYGYGNSTSVSISNNSISNPGNAVVLSLVKTGNYYLIKNGDNNIGMNNSGLTEGTSTGNAYQWTVTINNGYTRIRNRSNNSYYFYYSTRYDQFYVTNSTSNINVNLFKATEHTTTGTIPGWRGFYAWRVKSLGGGLSITGKNVGDIIYPDETIEFVTANAEGNEVEFEALWAQAYVNSNTYVSNSGNYKNAYERNFKVVTSLTTYNYPVTISSIYPDGSGTVASVSRTSNYSCSNDVKLENMTLSMANYYLDGNNHSLHIGRGVANGNNNVASAVYGYLQPSGNINGFTLRIESGRYNNAYLFYNNNTSQVSSSNNWNLILGSDYDRAKKVNSKLTITGPVEVSYRVSSSSASAKINFVGLSGTFGANSDNNELYMGYENRADANTAATPRFLEVLGGEYLGGISGGIENGVTATTHVLTMRIKGGTVHQYVYGAGQFSAAIGTRKTIITGGTFDAWVAGGCYGTDANGNAGNTDGDSYIYFGGDANMTDTEGVFGGGYGRGDAGDNKYTINKSFVVVADEAQIAGNVYGGGNKGYNTDDAEVYVLGGGENTIKVSGSVFGGANQARSEAKTTVTMKDGEVTGSLYGGANASGNVAGLATVNVSGGKVSNVYGGGLGASTSMAAGTAVNVSGGTINNNVYGGGEQGTVTGNTNVAVSGGTMKNVFGAGKGGTTTAQITGQTFVTVSGGTISQSVYGGGEAGDVVKSGQLASTVTVSGGSIAGDVFGGGRMGKTNGNTEVDIKAGTIRGNVFGGAYGSTGTVYVAGTHTVNIMGGRIFSSVYGGSRNANDALSFTGYDTTEEDMSSVVNISAGQVDEQVYAAGYFGSTYGSVFVFVGKEAILNAPNHAPSFGEENENMYKTGKLLLAYNVWAGSDFGTFSGGTFTAPNISGYSNIYVDGDGYDTQTSDESAPTYMNIKGSLLGCGTSGDAGTKGRGIYVRNYGHANGGSKNDEFPEPFSDATRSFFSIQRADTLVIDNSHINFTGQAKINSLDATEKYAIYSFDKTVRMTGGSSIFLNAPVYQIIDFWSATVDDLYNGMNAVYTPIAYNGLGAAGGPIDNKVRVNGGNYIEIYHDRMTYENNTVAAGYGMLNGFAHMMVASSLTDNTCAYARPKQCDYTPIDGSLDNPNDGGWVSYDNEKNTFDIGGHTVSAGSSDQLPYENHTTNSKAGEQYFRIWRVGGMYSEREGVINAYADGTESFNFVDVTIKLPAWRSGSAYYKFETSGEGSNLNTTIDYGPDVMTYATAIASKTGTTQNWVHFVETTDQQLTGADANAQNQINQNPNVNFGLVTLAGEGMSLSSPVAEQGGLIVCPESDQFLASVGDNGTVNRFNCSNNTVEPQVTFRLTYSNLISTNMTWDPMFVTLVQCDASGKITDIVKISLTINTYTTINNVFTTQTYAMMDGNHGTSDTYTAKVILPSFTLHDYAADHLSQFTLTNVTFEPNNVDATSQDCWKPKGSSYDFTHFAMEIAASRNEDNSDGWNGTATGTFDSHNLPNGGILLGETGARTPFAFDFTLTYNGNNDGEAFNEDSQHPALLGVLTFTIKFTNYINGTGSDHSQLLTIKVQVIRRGVGKVFYLDGQNGSNANSALYPNDAALSLSYIFNRCGYLPGDIIYIVNKVDVTKNLEWSGSAYNGVTIYRYPGDHPLVSKQKRNANGDFLYYDPETGEETTEAETDGVPNEPVMITPPIVGNEDNEAFTGALVAVGNKGNLTIRDITLDGHMSNHNSPVETETGIDAGVTAVSPMITIAQGGTLTLTNGSMLQQNNSTADGGAVAVNGGTLMMNNDASIKNNVTSGNGGAVYMAGTMIVSDAVQLIDNTKGTTANNVYLVGQDNVIQIGTSDASDEFGPFTYTQKTNSNGLPLYWTDVNQTEMTTDVTAYPVMIPAAQIGVTKTLYGNVDGYTEVVKVETESELDWLEDPYVRPNVIIFHDGHKYELEKYNDPTYLYWIGTWVTVQYWNPEYESDQVSGYDPNNFDGHLDNIDTPEELAWLISYVNGLNGASAHPDAVATITADIDMDASIWVPIGNSNTPYEGTFEGNGHVISGIHSILVNDDAAMFGVTEGATIQNVQAVVYFDGNSINKGTFIGTMNGGTLANVEAAGTLIGKANTINMGGLVGLANGTSENKSLIHSGFSVNTIIAEKASTVVGGLVGSLGDVVVDENDVTSNYYGNLYNSYANLTLGGSNVATIVGGLVGINNVGCTVENCYVISPINPSAVFAYINNGTVDYCYAANGTGTESLFENGNNTDTPVGYGTYDAVKERKELGYMYGDNVVTAQTADTTYIRSKIVYDKKIIEWSGLLSTLNQWVKANPRQLTPAPTKWFRPTTGDLNGDLPVLAFPKDNCFGNLAAEDGKILRYSAYNIDPEEGETFNNGLDNLLGVVYKNKAANIFLYGDATDVLNGTENNNLFINEDAVLLQKKAENATSMEPITATVGITFDNSDHGKTSYDYYGNKLLYDWHMMSTPLADAPLGATYDEGATMAFGTPVNIQSLEGSYFPDGLITDDNPAVGGDLKWDLYSYFEPQYHWINLKRSTDNHWHIDGDHEAIVDSEGNNYQNETTFVPGKGYMMAINQDSYLSSTGILNTGGEKVEITNQEPLDPTYNKGWNLVGNPYQAYLDLTKVTSSKNQFYIYDAEQGVYVPYTVGQSANSVTPSRYIHPHQAFFMYSSAESEEYVFDYTWATAKQDENGLSYFRGSDNQLNYPLVNLFAENQLGNRDLTIIEFNRPELGGATKVKGLHNTDFKIAASLNGLEYGMLFTPEGTEKVPVHFQTETDGTFTFKWNMENGDFTSLRLIDNKTGVNYDMLANDSYTFEASVDDYSSRFYITYMVTGVDEEVVFDSNSFAFFNGSEWVINGKGRLDVIDMTGRVLYAAQLNSDQNKVNLDGFAKGVYLLRVIDNKVVRTQKIIVR